jgi:hypothetical protein
VAGVLPTRDCCEICAVQARDFFQKLFKREHMKTALEQFIEWLEQNHPSALPGPETKEHFFMKEKIDQQLSYNAGFAKAKSLYLDAE